MKKYSELFILSTLTFVTLLLASCGGTPLYSGADMTKQEHIALSVDKAAEYLDDTHLLTKMIFVPVSGRGVTKYAGHLHCYYYEPGNDTLKHINIYLVAEDNTDPVYLDSKTISKLDLKTKRENALPLSQIDFSKIAQNIIAAGTTTEQLGKDNNKAISFSGVGTYTINIDSDASKVKHEFSIESRDTVKSTKRRDIYDEYKFVAVGGGEPERIKQ